MKILDCLEKFYSFFECREEALRQAADFADWPDHEKREWALQYDYLFRGTDASFCAPLWASVTFDEKVLWNQTTLDVIRFYHKLGYEPVLMEGNPADYIGEQLRFLHYLCSCLNSVSPQQMQMLLDAVDEFISDYTLGTARALWKAVCAYPGVFCGYQSYLEKLLQFLADPDLSQLLKEEVLALYCKQEGSVQAGTSAAISGPVTLAPPIPDEEAKTTNTGGINNCGGICVIRPTVQENCMLRIETDISCNAPQLRACVRGRGYRKTYLSPDRLRYPMKRVGKRGEGKFERISWKEALDLLASEWTRIRDSYGPASRYVIYGTGSQGIMQPRSLMQRLLALDGGYLGYFNSYSSACVNYIANYIYGPLPAGTSAADLLNTKLLILWADNTAESIFGPERNYYMSLLKKHGVRIICIDPRLSQTAVAYADEWYAIKPSTDAALADAMAYVIWSEGLQDQAFMDRYCLGFDEDHMPEGVPAGESYHSYLFGRKDGIAKTPEWAEPITGISADRIRRLARLYAGTKPACISTGLGAQRHGNGEQSARGICMLTCLTGNVGIPGGGNGANVSMLAEHRDIGLFTNRVVNPYPGRIPTFLWTQAIESGTEMTPRKDRLTGVEKLDSNIKMIFNIASNILINQHSNINDTIRILKDTSKCEFIVCSDVFMTPSARFADLILPATSVFEGENIVHSWAGSNYFLKNNPVIKPLFECRFEWDWLKELAARLGLYHAFTEGKPELTTWLRENYNILREKEPELPDYDTFSQLGGWQFREQVCAVAFEKQIADPDRYPFPTPSGKIEIFSKRLYDFDQRDDIPAIPKYVPCPNGPEDPLRSKYPLQLIGWHTRRRCHSIHDNNEWQDEVEMPGLWIHPTDAAARNIANGDLIRIWNDIGAVQIPAIVTTRIRPGVTAMSQGGWYTPDADGTDTRGSINILTSSRPTPLAKGNPQHTNLVEAARICPEAAATKSI